jgi:hypothetical protein
VDLEPGKVNRLEVDLTKGSEVAGQVRGPRGEPLEDVAVLLRSGGERPYEYGAITDPDGKYRLAGLPEGSYTLEAKRWARRTAPG